MHVDVFLQFSNLYQQHLKFFHHYLLYLAVIFSDLIDSAKVNGFDGLNGISFANESTSPYGTSKTLPISLTAALEAKVPKVII